MCPLKDDDLQAIAKALLRVPVALCYEAFTAYANEKQVEEDEMPVELSRFTALRTKMLEEENVKEVCRYMGRYALISCKAQANEGFFSRRPLY